MHTLPSKKTDKGFTLIELLIVIAIIGFLAASVLVAVDPVKRIQDSRDARRFSEANALLNAILTKQVDDRALYDGDEDDDDVPIITDATYAQVIVSDPTGILCDDEATRPGCDVLIDTSGANTDCVADLMEVEDTTEPVLSLIPNYIAEIPLDPRGAGEGPCITGSGCAVEGDLDLGDSNSGYYIHRTVGNRIEIGSCSPEQETTIRVKR